MKTPFVAVAVFVALILGAGLGWFLANDNQETLTPTAQHKDLPDLRQESLKLTAELHREIDDKKAEIRVHKARIETLEDKAKADPTPIPETEDWQGKHVEAQAALAKAEAEIEGLKAKLTAEKPEIEPKAESTLYVDWGKYSEIEGFATADWKDLGETYTKMMAKMELMRAAYAEGGAPSAKLQQEVGKINEKLITHYIGILGKVPTEMPRANGEFTHPANLVNILAGQLDSAGMPLSDDQLTELKTLAETYDSKWDKITEGFTENTWRLERLQSECQLKEWFKAEMFKITTPEQKVTALPDSLDGLLGFDLYSAGLMLQQVAAPKMQITEATQDEIRTTLKAAIAGGTKLTAEQVEGANYIFDAWMFSVQDRMGPFTEAELSLRYTADIMAALDAEIVALKALYNDIANSDEERKSISTQFGIVQLRLKKTD
ncbi:MAG: hypothetical protein V3V10_07850 [Planctomycetota bacterium]